MTQAKWSDSVKTLACFSLRTYWHSSHGEKAWPPTSPRLHLKSFCCKWVTVMMNSLVTSPEILRNRSSLESVFTFGSVWSWCWGFYKSHVVWVEGTLIPRKRGLEVIVGQKKKKVYTKVTWMNKVLMCLFLEKGHTCSHIYIGVWLLPE